MVEILDQNVKFALLAEPRFVLWFENPSLVMATDQPALGS